MSGRKKSNYELAAIPHLSLFLRSFGQLHLTASNKRDGARSQLAKVAQIFTRFIYGVEISLKQAFKYTKLFIGL